MMVYLITSDVIGSEDPELGRRLMYNFFMKMLLTGQKPSYILFLERGVKLLLPEFSAIDALRILQEEYGVELVACKTCLDYYGITGEIAVGSPGSMADIIAIMHDSVKVIHL